MDTKPYLIELKALISKNLEIEAPSELEEIKKQVYQVLLDLLEQGKLEKLRQIAYRIDIDQNRFETVLYQEKTIQLQASLLRDLFIEREVQKAKTRIQYAD